ncbi:beta-carotene 15,15'-monooxygenase [Elizabethkingia anophelis]|uniref:beta-carotene 15,15'-monooxygenase n=1 Tax=Elizabethkingia anophelis TaxID=1117645 RepID=UPI002012BF64|nr:beta-carotene 15,15'-monooxygenase [Elizabethkingia anophelis]MCL1691841.1 beta-carotene 15,15'-monooxygenase [Elizabethkingia anophelis]MDV3573541.1 beta-carotene 15,15'-monooxygenase [Elizabethkingia anophelis]MDV3598953.1 beta-carotene 15,15'-monooxygenase [Elizabethkingia anophelis]MDV3608177.1 beta-carotene 15,15'-monooxygenase [Elizabethkingia anophelis]MDV3637323.1 beta-carotene 15,15'-monooxygenase [Elizabethkingia anophelis]
MTTNIKNLFRLKSSETDNLNGNIITEAEAESPEDKDEIRKRTYHETGYRDGSRNLGRPIAFSISLSAVYARFQNEEKEQVEKQHGIKESYYNEQTGKETEIRGLQVSLENKEEQISRLGEQIKPVKEKIEELKFEINDLARNPEKYHIKSTKGASTKFWIGLAILIPLSLYLFTFYISTSYSVFFKEFDPNSTVIMNMLDPKALEVAWQAGILEGGFVTLIPFVFLGLGYLIHMFGENKTWINRIKIGSLFIITFMFDVILAYQIDEKIYMANQTPGSPDFNFKIALTSFSFWGIIFAGFIVYIIWGLVFDFIMKEHKEKDRIKHEQQKREQDIRIYQERITEFEQQKEALVKERHDMKERIVTSQGRIAELQRIIDAVIIPTKEYVLYASEYAQGWITFINERGFAADHVKRELEEECMRTYNEHIESVGAHEEIQNSVYLPVL